MVFCDDERPSVLCQYASLLCLPEEIPHGYPLFPRDGLGIEGLRLGSVV